MAHKLFGQTDPLGKTVKLFNRLTCKITGVYAIPSTPAHVEPQMILRDRWVEQGSNWENYSYITYVVGKPGITEEQIADHANRIFYEDHLRTDSKSYDAYVKAGHPPVLVVESVQNIHNFPKSGGGAFKTTLSLWGFPD